MLILVRLLAAISSGKTRFGTAQIEVGWIIGGKAATLGIASQGRLKVFTWRGRCARGVLGGAAAAEQSERAEQDHAEG